ncbi:MoxR family ATPase [Isoptericola hypogeus]|uniref:MoxR family ATPase n=1 Tax=Isoptericola hypogeus TaxID=300179 RepID=A0ABN2JQP0_9MICO
MTRPTTSPADDGLAPATLTTADVAALGDRVLDAVGTAVVGMRDTLELALATVLAGGHVLFEDVPGLGKTLAARSLAGALGLDFARLQCTPDLLPGDITGSTVFDPASRELVFRPGPVFTGLFLADEINRTPPKTQSALLEAMAEGQVSVDGVSHPLPAPFHVMATSNPVEYEGTYPLPEAQLDRFMVRLSVGYPTRDQERQVLLRRVARRQEAAPVPRVTDAAAVRAMQAGVESTTVDPDVAAYCVDLAAATRGHPALEVGASPRGSQNLLLVSRAVAVLDGRDFVLPEDVKRVAVPVLAHRLTLTPTAWASAVRAEDVVRELLATVPGPATVAPEAG